MQVTALQERVRKTPTRSHERDQDESPAPSVQEVDSSEIEAEIADLMDEIDAILAQNLDALSDFRQLPGE